MDDKNLDEKSLVSDSNCNTLNLQSPKKLYKEGLINDVGLALSVGDSTTRFTMSFEQDVL